MTQVEYMAIVCQKTIHLISKRSNYLPQLLILISERIIPSYYIYKYYIETSYTPKQKPPSTVNFHKTCWMTVILSLQESTDYSKITKSVTVG